MGNESKLFARSLTILMPCLNEERTVDSCIKEALAFLNLNSIPGEVLVVDNGSTDCSVNVAGTAGARVISTTERGYGNALRFGIENAMTNLVIFGDADLSYDFFAIGEMYELLCRGADLVVGNRFGGGIERGAMPLLNRYLGNPLLSLIGRKLYSVEIGDFHCGLRGLRKESFRNVQLVAPGMEFATEIIAEAALKDLKIVETPVKLRRDGRGGKSHLRRWTDGLRHITFMVSRSRSKPLAQLGAGVSLLGATLFVFLYVSPLGTPRRSVDLGALILSSLIVTFGTQLLVISAALKAVREPYQLWSTRSSTHASSSRNLYTDVRRLCSTSGLVGVVWLLGETFFWINSGMPETDFRISVRRAILPTLLLTIWSQGLVAQIYLHLVRRNLPHLTRSNHRS